MTRNMKLRLAIKFTTPYECIERRSNALPPWQEKASNAWGMRGWGGGGEMLKLRFYWYNTDRNFQEAIESGYPNLI